MSNILLPTHLAGTTIPRYIEHERAILALCQLRDKYSSISPEYKVLDAMCETVNRLGGRVVTETGVKLIDNLNDSHKLASEGLGAVVHYLTT